MKQTIFTTSVFLFTVSVFIGCSKEEGIIGTWKSDYNQTLILKANNEALWLIDSHKEHKLLPVELYHPPLFCGLNFCISGIPTVVKSDLIAALTANGASYCGSLCDVVMPTLTHCITEPTRVPATWGVGADKLRFVAEFNSRVPASRPDKLIAVVSPAWVHQILNTKSKFIVLDVLSRLLM